MSINIIKEIKWGLVNTSRPESPFSLQGATLFFSSDSTLSTHDFWNKLENQLENNDSWNTLSVKGAEIERSSCAIWVKLGRQLELSPEELAQIAHELDCENLKLLFELNMPLLHKAIRLGAYEAVERLLAAGADVNACNKHLENPLYKGASALYIAYTYNHSSIMQLLLRSGADIAPLRKVNALRNSHQNHPEYAAYLIEYGYLEKPTRCALDAKHELHAAAETNDKDYLAFLLKHGADVNQLDRDSSVVFVALQNNHVKLAKWLVTIHNAKLNNGKDLFEIAIKIKNLDMIEFLLKKGASIDTSFFSPWYLHPIALAKEDKSILKILQKNGLKAPVEYAESLFLKNKDGSDLLVTLIEMGLIDPTWSVRISHFFEKTALFFHAAILHKKIKLIDAFIKAGVDVHRPDNNGVPPLHIAVVMGDLETVRSLVRAGANVNCKTRTEITPLHLAVDYAFPKIVSFLIEQKADVNATDFNGTIPFYRGSALLSTTSLRKELMDAGSDIMTNPLSFYIFYKETRLPKFEEKAPLVSKETKILWQERFYRKILAHVTDIAGTSQIKHRSQNVTKEIKLTGSYYSTWIVRRGVKVTNYIIKQNILNSSKATWEPLLSTLSFIAEDFEKPAADYHARILSGKPTLIRSGFWHHAIDFVIYKNLLVICNRGRGSTYCNSIEVLEFNPKKLTVDHVFQLRQITSLSFFNYRKRLYHLKEDLNAVYNKKTNAIENRCKLPMQTAGFCDWNSFEAAIWSLIVLPQLEGVALEAIATKAATLESTFTKWTSLFGAQMARKYLDFHLSDRSVYFPETQFVSSIIANARKNALPIEKVLTEKLDELNKRFPDLPNTIIKAKQKTKDNKVKSKEPTYETITKEYFSRIEG